MFRQDGSCPALLEDLGLGFPYGAVTRYGSPFQTLPVPKTQATGLIRVRSPLLTESRLMSFPPATEMFQFTGFASCAYGLSAGYPLRGGLPHSEIPGSTIARISPGLFAACHVLHRLSVPRHPPDALDSRLSATPNGKDHRDATNSPLRRHYGIRAARPCGLAGADTASVTQFASSQFSINKRHRRSIDLPVTKSVPLPRFPVIRSRGARPRRLVEVNGLEPMTSCLQSRRSPS